MCCSRYRASQGRFHLVDVRSRSWQPVIDRRRTTRAHRLHARPDRRYRELVGLRASCTADIFGSPGRSSHPASAGFSTAHHDREASYVHSASRAPLYGSATVGTPDTTDATLTPQCRRRCGPASRDAPHRFQTVFVPLTAVVCRALGRTHSGIDTSTVHHFPF